MLLTWCCLLEKLLLAMKLCFWLIENKFTVLIAACDTFRAINHARDSVIDMVLVDTAGMMQDNEPLMRALSKIILVRMK